MDVRCDRCKTEYEFDDARVTEAGVAVKCTNCGHVFKVKKKAVVFTVPVKAEESEQNVPAELNAGPTLTAPTSEKKEWKVRQTSGSIVSFRELTTMQKWIIERKLSRDDEISLTGETWKRLGDIPELSSFFQIVDEANLARLMSLPAESKKTARAPPPIFDLPGTQPGAAEGSPNWSPLEEMRTRVRSAQGVRSADRDDFAIPPNPAWKWLGAVAIAGLVLALYVFWPRANNPAVVRASPRDEKRETVKPSPPETVVLPPAAMDASVVDAQPDVGTASGTTAVAVREQTSDSGTATKVKGLPFDTLLSRANRLRESDKPAEALIAYQEAIDVKPNRPEPFGGRGLAYLDMGQPGMAEAEFKQALRLNPRYGTAIMGLAETYRALGRKDDAIEYYQLYLEELPRGPEAAVAQTQIQRLQE